MFRGKSGWVTLNIEVTPDGIQITNGAGEVRRCSRSCQIRFGSNDQPELDIRDLAEEPVQAIHVFGQLREGNFLTT